EVSRYRWAKTRSVVWPAGRAALAVSSPGDASDSLIGTATLAVRPVTAGARRAARTARPAGGFGPPTGENGADEAPRRQAAPRQPGHRHRTGAGGARRAGIGDRRGGAGTARRARVDRPGARRDAGP